jgi:hypothetical protein
VECKKSLSKYGNIFSTANCDTFTLKKISIKLKASAIFCTKNVRDSMKSCYIVPSLLL